MTGLTDVRDRTLTMLRAVGIEPDRKQMRTVEKYVRWVDGQISTAHIDGRVMDREVARGHEMTVTHNPIHGTEYTVVTLELVNHDTTTTQETNVMKIDPARIGEAAALLQAVERSENSLALSPEACGNLAFLLRHAQDMAEVDILPHDFHEAVPLVVDSILGKDDSTD